MSPIWFERPDIFPLLLKRVQSFASGYRQNVALLGRPGMGKTSLLRHLVDGIYPPQSAMVCFHVEVRPSEPLVEWCAQFIQSLFYGVLRCGGCEKLPSTWSDLILESRNRLPRTVAHAVRVLDLAESGKSDEAYDQLWELPAMVTQETQAQVLLVLDEFHELENLKVKDPFKPLGQRVMLQSSTLFFLASSEISRARAILKEGLALLFGQFEILELGHLSPAISRAAIETACGQSAGDPLLTHLLMGLAQGHPRHLNLLIEAWSQMESHLPAEESLRNRLASLLEVLFMAPQAQLRQEFEERLRSLPSDRNRRICVQIVEAIASGERRLEKIALTLERPRTQIKAGLEVLEQAGVVVRRGVFYWIHDRLFSLWLQTAYPVLHGVALVEFPKAKADFRCSILKWMEQSSESLETPLSLRLTEWMRRWSGEKVQVEERWLVLPELEKVTLDKAKQPPLITAKRVGGGGWLVVPWAGRLSEQQAREVLTHLKRHGNRASWQKVVMGATPADLNAKLVLREGKIRLWDLEILNDLFEMYGLSSLACPITEAGGWPHAPVRVEPSPSMDPKASTEGVAG